MEEIRIVGADIGVQSTCPILFSHLNTKESTLDAPYHLHDCLELYVYGTGDVDFFVGEKNYRLQSGDIVFTLPNELHRPCIRSATEYERFYVQIPVDAFSHFDRMAASPIDRFLSAPSADRFIRADEETRQEILTLLRAISREAAKRQSGYLAYAMLLRLLGLLDKERISGEMCSPVSDLVRHALRYVGENALTVSGVGEVARALHVHPSYLSARFSAEMKTGLKQYIIYKKISVAKQLLLEGGTVADVCYRTGFCSSSHFIETFRAVVGETPRKYVAGYFKK